MPEIAEARLQNFPNSGRDFKTKDRAVAGAPQDFMEKICSGASFAASLLLYFPKQRFSLQNLLERCAEMDVQKYIIQCRRIFKNAVL